jgi:hypothetical protein
MAPVLPDPDLRAERPIAFILRPSFQRRPFRRLVVHQLLHSLRRQRSREGRDQRLLELCLGPRRPTLLDFRGRQHPFYVYFFGVPRANEVFQDHSLQVAACINELTITTRYSIMYFRDRIGCSGYGGPGFEFLKYRAQGARGSQNDGSV